MVRQGGLQGIPLNAGSLAITYGHLDPADSGIVSEKKGGTTHESGSPFHVRETFE